MELGVRLTDSGAWFTLLARDAEAVDVHAAVTVAQFYIDETGRPFTESLSAFDVQVHRRLKGYLNSYLPDCYSWESF